MAHNQRVPHPMRLNMKNRYRYGGCRGPHRHRKHFLSWNVNGKVGYLPETNSDKRLYANYQRIAR
jgi:hypothetical protein